MSGGLRAVMLCLGAAVVPPGAAAAQSFTGQSAELQMVALARSGHAIWVNPAGLASRDASIEGLATLRRGTTVELANFGLAVTTGGIAFGYQRDRRSDGRSGTAYALAAGLGDSVLSLGFARRWYKSGGVLEGTWDLGLRWRPRPQVTLALAWRDLNSPVIRDTTVAAALLPAAAIRIGRLSLGGEWEIIPGDWGTSAVRAGAAVRLGRSLEVALRGTFSGGLAARAIAAQLEWNGVGVNAGAFAVEGRRGESDQAGVTGALVSRPLERRRWR